MSRTSMTAPEFDDRIVYFTDGRWRSWRYGGQRGRFHDSRKEAIAHARRMLDKQGFGRLLEMEQVGEDETRFRILRRHVR